MKRDRRRGGRPDHHGGRTESRHGGHAPERPAPAAGHGGRGGPGRRPGGPGGGTARLKGVCAFSRGEGRVLLDAPFRGRSFLRLARTDLPLLSGDRILVAATWERGRLRTTEARRLLVPNDGPLAVRVGRPVPSAEGGAGLAARPLDGAPARVLLAGDVAGLEEGDLVLVRPLERADGVVRAVAVERLSPENTVFAQERLTKINHGAPGEFPEACLAEADALPPDILSPGGPEQPLDLTGLAFATIDGADAKDFDDAVWAGRGEDGSYLLKVAIADVSRHVRPGSALDDEALRRGNSWYFPASVEPMLPKALSDDLCSLVPDEPRPVVAVSLEISADGRTLSASFGEAVIRSAARLTYDGARALVSERDGRALEEFSASNPRSGEVLASLERALEVSRVLAEARRRRGSLDFDLPAPAASFDGEGRVLALRRSRTHEIHGLVEACMIAANEAVAAHLEREGFPVLFRTHDEPSPEKVAALAARLAACGFPADEGETDVGRLLAAARARGRSPVLDRLFVRSLPRALYSPENVGHFALASKAYCHFTSPIRRYADLLAHRSLKASLGLDAGPIPAGRRLVRIAGMLNEQERRTQECERETARRLACLWMRTQDPSRTWEGTVTSVQPSGAFVELDEAPVEGFVAAGDMGGRMSYTAGAEVLEGPSGSWRAGRRCRVRLVSVDMVPLFVNFSGSLLPDGRRRPRGGQGRR